MLFGLLPFVMVSPLSCVYPNLSLFYFADSRAIRRYMDGEFEGFSFAPCDLEFIRSLLPRK